MVIPREFGTHSNERDEVRMTADEGKSDEIHILPKLGNRRLRLVFR